MMGKFNTGNPIKKKKKKHGFSAVPVDVPETNPLMDPNTLKIRMTPQYNIPNIFRDGS